MNTLDYPANVPNNDAKTFGRATNMVVTPPGTYWASETVEALKEGFACEQCARITFGQLDANRRGLFILRMNEWCKNDSCVVEMALQASNSMKLPLFVVLIPYAEQVNENPTSAPILRFTPDDCWISSLSFSPEDMYASVRTKIAVFNSSPKRVINTSDGFCVLMVDADSTYFSDVGLSNGDSYGSDNQNTIGYTGSNSNDNNDQNSCDNSMVATSNCQETFLHEKTGPSVEYDNDMADKNGQNTYGNVFSVVSGQEEPVKSFTFSPAPPCGEETQKNDSSPAVDSIPFYGEAYFEKFNDGQNSSSRLKAQSCNFGSSFGQVNILGNDELDVEEVLRELEANDENHNVKGFNDAIDCPAQQYNEYSTTMGAGGIVRVTRSQIETNNRPKDDCGQKEARNYLPPPNDECDTNWETSFTQNMNNYESNDSLMNEFTDYETYMGSEKLEQASNPDENNLHDSAIENYDTWNSHDLNEPTHINDMEEAANYSQFGLLTPTPDGSEPIEPPNNNYTTSGSPNTPLISPPLEQLLNSQLKDIFFSGIQQNSNQHTSAPSH